MNKGFRGLYGRLIKYWATGTNNVVGRVSGVFSIVLLFATFLTVRGYIFSNEQLVLFGIVIVLMIFVGGWLYIKLDLYKAEASSYNQENPELMEIRDTVRRLEKKVGGLDCKEESVNSPIK